VTTSVPRFSAFRLMVGNALGVSALYLAMGLVFESLRRYSSWRWAEKAVVVLDALPARVLQLLGALAPLRELYMVGQVDELMVRLIYGSTTVALIFVTAMGVSVVMAAFRGLLQRD
jgi:hypothetical protein